MDLTTPEGVAKHMLAATSEDDWNRRCLEVKKANDGYPSFWYPTIIMSGLADEAQTNW